MRSPQTDGAGAELNTGYLNKASLCAFLGGTDKPLGKSTINEWMKSRNFPKPIRLSANCALWRVSEVVAWVETQTKSA